MDVLVSGSSGLIGTALVDTLRAGGHHAVRLVRGAGATAAPDAVAWDPVAGTIDAGALEGIDAVVHLAGAGIGDHRWTSAYRSTLVDSRVRPTDLLARALAGLTRRPSVLVSGSAIGYYGDRGDEELTEQSSIGTGFLPELCQQWESATAPAEAAGIRVARIRSGVVLSPRGGALRKQLPLFKFGLGGRFGSGRQWQSWISIDDEVGAIIHLLTHELRGAVNLTAPTPVTNAEFTVALGRALHRPTVLPIPRFGPALLLGRELADNLLFSSARVLPDALRASGYVFRHATLAAAFADLL